MVGGARERDVYNIDDNILGRVDRIEYCPIKIINNIQKRLPILCF